MHRNSRGSPTGGAWVIRNSFGHGSDKRPRDASGAAASGHSVVHQKNHDRIDDGDNDAENVQSRDAASSNRSDKKASDQCAGYPDRIVEPKGLACWSAILLCGTEKAFSSRRFEATLLLASVRIGATYPGTLGEAWCWNRNGGVLMFLLIDRVCGQFAAALQHQQLHVYATIAVIVVLSVLLFPPRDDPDQI